MREDAGADAVVGTTRLNWLGFHSRFQEWADYPKWSPIEDELFGYLSGRNRTSVAREVARVVALIGRSLSPPPKGPAGHSGRYDYCFVVDGTGANGLGTVLPIIEAAPSHSRIIMLTRSWVLRDTRLKALSQTRMNLDVVNVDTAGSAGALSVAEICRDVSKGLSLAQGKWYVLPQLLIRRAICDAVVGALIEPSRVRNVVVANERMLLSNLSVRTAQRVGVKSWCLQHGLLVETYLPVLCDEYLVWGARSKEWLTERGVEASISILGAPRLDALAALAVPADPPPVATDRARTPPSLLFFSQPPGVDAPAPEYMYCWQAVLDFARRYKGEFETRIKLHPAENVTHYEEAFGRSALDHASILPADADALGEISRCDYVVSFHSTTLIEAMLCQKPCLQLFRDGVDVTDYGEGGGAIRVRSGDELAEQIHALVAAPAYRQAVVSRQRDYAEGHVENLGAASRMFFDFVS